MSFDFNKNIKDNNVDNIDNQILSYLISKINKNIQEAYNKSRNTSFSIKHEVFTINNDQVIFNNKAFPASALSTLAYVLYEIGIELDIDILTKFNIANKKEIIIPRSMYISYTNFHGFVLDVKYNRYEFHKDEFIFYLKFLNWLVYNADNLKLGSISSAWMANMQITNYYEFLQFVYQCVHDSNIAKYVNVQCSLIEQIIRQNIGRNFSFELREILIDTWYRLYYCILDPTIYETCNLFLKFMSWLKFSEISYIFTTKSIKKSDMHFLVNIDVYTLNHQEKQISEEKELIKLFSTN